MPITRRKFVGTTLCASTLIVSFAMYFVENVTSPAPTVPSFFVAYWA